MKKYRIEIAIRNNDTSLKSEITFDTDSLESLIIPIGDLFEKGVLFISTTTNVSMRPA